MCMCIYIYIYIYIYRFEPTTRSPQIHTSVCEKNTPPEKNTLGEMSSENTKSGAGEEFMLLCCKERAFVKGVFFSQTPVGSLEFRAVQSSKLSDLADSSAISKPAVSKGRAVSSHLVVQWFADGRPGESSCLGKT